MTKPTKKNIMRSFRMTEISGVDKPAQAGALVSLMKRAEPTTEDAATLAKRAGLTTVTQGHTHLVIINYEDRYEAMGDRTHGQTSYEAGHSHPWVMNAEGVVVIGEAAGHTHTMAEMGISQAQAWEFLNKAFDPVNKKESTMDDEAKKKLLDAEKDKKELDALKSQVSTLSLIAAMNDVEKGHYNTLAEDAKTAFLAKSADERKADVSAATELAKSADPVVYTAADGAVFKKSDDPRLVTMAKQLDKDRKDLATANAIAKNAAFAKTAREDFQFLPGTEEVRTELAKAVDGIADAVMKEEVMKSLKAHNAKMAPAFKTFGAGGQPQVEGSDAASAEAELDTLAKSIAAKDGVDYYTAYEKAGVQKPDLLKRATLG